MKTRMVFWSLLAVVVLAVAWCYAVPAEWRERLTEPVQAAGWDVLVKPEKKEVCNSFGPLELRAKPMAKTQVSGANLSASFTFKQAIWPGMGGAGGYHLDAVTVATPLGNFMFNGYYDDPGHPGQWGLLAMMTGVPLGIVWYDTPTDPADIYWIEVPCSVAMTGSTATKLTHSTVPIGEKGATHAKECVLTEEWFVPAGTEYIVTIGDQSSTLVTEVDRTAALSMALGGSNIDADDWSAYLVGTKYAMSIENICFGPVAIDTSSFTARTWGGTSASENKLWVEGFGGNSIGFWCSEAFYNGPYVYNDYPGGTISAPLSYDFSGCIAKWMSGANADSLACVCTGLRKLSTQEDVDNGLAAAVGKDIGPWTGTLAELKALGRVTQKHGCYYWDTCAPDMQGTVEISFPYDSLRAHGALDHPAPTYKVEGCQYRGESVTADEEGNITPADSAVNGDYWVRGQKNGLDKLTNGLYWIWALDAEGADYAIGPSPDDAPYYITDDGGGISNIYVVNEAAYTDAVINEDLGWKRFTGLTGFGPSVSLQANPADPDTSTPSFSHDGTFIFDAWPLSATSRTGTPYMPDVYALHHRGATYDANHNMTGFVGLGIYGPGPAHDHTDWVASAGVTVPDANGNFTVTAAGATLTLTIASNFIARNTEAKGTGHPGTCPVPTCYQTTKADALYGLYTSEASHEGIYDWRGWRYLQSKFILPEAVTTTTIGTQISYYMHLDGVTDNHKSDNSRQTEYSFTPGTLYTYSRDASITWRDETTREAPFLFDLYWAERPVSLVTTLQFTFTDVGDYRIEEPELWLDPGDKQAGREAYVRPGETVAYHGGGHKSCESYMYAQGGLSGYVDGMFDRALYMPDNAKGNQIEYCFPSLNVLFAGASGLDMTSVYTLAGLPVTNSSDAWEWMYYGEGQHMTDGDGNTLKVLSMADLPPSIDNLPDPAVRCFRIVCVNGLPYTFRGTKLLGGLGHGMAKSADYTSKRGTIDADGLPETQIGALYRRPLGSTDDADYVLVDSDVRCDEHGHWTAPQDYTDPYDDGPDSASTSALQVQYEYAIKGKGTSDYESLGWFATREFSAVDVLSIAGIQHPFLREGCSARLYLVCKKDSVVHMCRLPNGMSWDDVDTGYVASGFAEWPALAYHRPFALGSLICGTTAQEAHRWRGDHNDWETAQSLAALGYSYPYVDWGLNTNYYYLAGYKGGSHMLAAFDALTGEVEWQKTIAAGSDAPGALGIQSGLRQLVYALPSGDDILLYWSRDDGDTWTLGGTSANLSYPSLDCACAQRFYLAGYSAGSAYCERWNYGPAMAIRATGRKTVGTVDADRVCIARLRGLCLPVIVAVKDGDLVAFRSWSDADTWTEMETVLTA